MEPLMDFVTLFRGRGDVYGHEEGRCVKETLSLEVFDNHLSGDQPIGTYPMVPHKGKYYVAWGCCDIDYESYSDARKIQDALAVVHIPSWIERSRSKGYHVWVFATGLVPASDMRRVLLLAHQVADVPAREVNPKQETLGPGQYGNYVRLPYPKSHADTGRRVVLKDEQNHYELAEFVQLAMESRTSPELLASIAQLWKEPERHTAVIDYGTEPTTREALANLSPLGKVIWRDGPLEGRDRSSTLTKLAHECVRSGLDPSSTKVVIVSADKRWGKYHLRPNGEYEIDKLVVRVYSNV
jgi:hypothetical protein